MHFGFCRLPLCAATVGAVYGFGTKQLPRLSPLPTANNEFLGNYKRLLPQLYVGIVQEKDTKPLFEEPLQDNEKKTKKEDAPFFRRLIEQTPQQQSNELDESSDPLANALRHMRCTVTSCPLLWRDMAQLCPTKRAVLDEHLCDEEIDYSYSDMWDMVLRAATVFKKLGVEKGNHVAILGENSAKWLIADHGIQLAGGASVVRGADAPIEEQRYIFHHSDSKEIVVLQGPKLLKKLITSAISKGMDGLGLHSDPHGPVRTVILMHREGASDDEIDNLAKSLGMHIFVISDMLQVTSPLTLDELPLINHEDLATIVYTSGTTGRPKGVMLTHGNLLHQVGLRFAPTRKFDDSEPLPGDVMLCLLPVWHITERTAELCVLSRGCSLVYTSIRYFKDDLAKHKPHCMMMVPRVLEKIASEVQNKLSHKSAVVKKLVSFFSAVGSARRRHSNVARGLVVGERKPNRLKRWKARSVAAALYPLDKLGNRLVWRKVQAAFGSRQKIIMSGGSALAGSLESFYDLCGIPVLVGYGLTECSPVIAHRQSDSNLVTAGCVGKPTLNTEVRIVDPKADGKNCERPALADGDLGLVLVRGPQVMRGYYKNDKATKKAIDPWGWFDTGDLGKINPATQDLLIVGRCKDTIVLSNGENVEPGPIEDAILANSKLIEQVMLLGQDQKELSAVVVLSPTELIEAGFLDPTVGHSLQQASDKVNSPVCTQEDCEEGCKELNTAAAVLRLNTDLDRSLRADLKEASQMFRHWEQVGNVYVSLEPFAMANGLLTQSYKVKRDKVKERYQNELICSGMLKEGYLHP